ncbi:MAG: hypothetical protein HY610_00665, partial [Elusimicrobia bacterium]|nr:hypothetical protein [Elusimicrobiota bacterium]
MKLLIAFGIGLGTLSCLIFLLAASGLIYTGSLLGLLAVLAVLCRSEINYLISLSKNIGNRLMTISFQKFEYFLLAVFCLAILANLIFNYSPPTQVREMDYNLTHPKTILRNHTIFGKFDKNDLTF